MWVRWGGGLGGFAALLLAAGCGSVTTTVRERAAASSTEHAATATATAPKELRYSGLSNPAQRPDPSVTAYCDEVAMGHACHAVTASPSDPNESPQRNCDRSIVANSSTSCSFAENAFYEAYESADSSRDSFSIEVYSPTTHKYYELGCEHSGRLLIGCISSPTSDGIYVSFPEAAIVAYTEGQAQAYATSHRLGHPPSPATGGSTGESTVSEGEKEDTGKGGESGSEDEVGSYSHAGDTSFCDAHECIGDFVGEDGYVVECEDGSYSHAGGKSGACSEHGGEKP